MDVLKIVFPLLLVFLSSVTATLSSRNLTMAFVIDTTKSMKTEIEGVKQVVKNVVDRMPSDSVNFVIVPFNDPSLDPFIVSSDAKAVTAFADNITTHNDHNVDCPELAMKGLLKALELSFPDSYIFFFSDASVKDYQLVKTVLAAANAKNSTIYFVLTGACTSPYTKLFTTYFELAKATQGKVYRIDEGRVTELMEGIIRNITETDLRFVTETMDRNYVSVTDTTKKPDSWIFMRWSLINCATAARFSSFLLVFVLFYPFQLIVFTNSLRL